MYSAYVPHYAPVLSNINPRGLWHFGYVLRKANIADEFARTCKLTKIVIEADGRKQIMSWDNDIGDKFYEE